MQDNNFGAMTCWAMDLLHGRAVVSGCASGEAYWTCWTCGLKSWFESMHPWTEHCPFQSISSVAVEVLYSETGLSFWGGVSPKSGIIVDRHHPLSGLSLHGKILAIPAGRGPLVSTHVNIGQQLVSDGVRAVMIEHLRSMLGRSVESLISLQSPSACSKSHRLAYLSKCGQSETKRGARYIICFYMSHIIHK